MIMFFGLVFKGYHKIFDFISNLRNHMRVIFPRWHCCQEWAVRGCDTNLANNGGWWINNPTSLLRQGFVAQAPGLRGTGERKEKQMKKIFGIAVATAAMATSAVAANMENPLFLPGAGDVYSKTTLGIMYKITDSTENQVLRGHSGSPEFPIWRPEQEFGVGITDRWAAHVIAGYTYDPDINRKGFHLGRLGTTYRIFGKETNFVWDMYGDFHLGGVERMKGKLVKSAISTTDLAKMFVFNYDNYSNGRWGAHLGTKFGYRWSNLSASAYAEVLRTWGNHNNEIDVSALSSLVAGLPREISVDIKSTWEVNAGANVFYQMSDKLSGGIAFNYKHHATNGLEGIHTDLLPDVQTAVNGLLKNFKDMRDRFDEYALSLTIAYQFTPGTQLAWYIEDTYDNGDRLSANTTDVKIESGFRFNFMF